MNNARRKANMIDIREIAWFFTISLYCAYSMLANVVGYYESAEIIHPLRKLLKYGIMGMIILIALYDSLYSEKRSFCSFFWGFLPPWSMFWAGTAVCFYPSA